MHEPEPAHLLRRHDLAWIALAVLAGGCFTYRWETKGPFEMTGAIRNLRRTSSP